MRSKSLMTDMTIGSGCTCRLGASGCTFRLGVDVHVHVHVDWEWMYILYILYCECTVPLIVWCMRLQLQAVRDCIILYVLIDIGPRPHATSKYSWPIECSLPIVTGYTHIHVPDSLVAIVRVEVQIQSRTCTF